MCVTSTAGGSATGPTAAAGGGRGAPEPAAASPEPFATPEPYPPGPQRRVNIKRDTVPPVAQRRRIVKQRGRSQTFDLRDPAHRAEFLGTLRSAIRHHDPLKHEPRSFRSERPIFAQASVERVAEQLRVVLYAFDLVRWPGDSAAFAFAASQSLRASSTELVGFDAIAVSAPNLAERAWETLLDSVAPHVEELALVQSFINDLLSGNRDLDGPDVGPWIKHLTDDRLRDARAALSAGRERSTEVRKRKDTLAALLRAESRSRRQPFSGSQPPFTGRVAQLDDDSLPAVIAGLEPLQTAADRAIGSGWLDSSTERAVTGWLKTLRVQLHEVDEPDNLTIERAAAKLAELLAPPAATAEEIGRALAPDDPELAGDIAGGLAAVVGDAGRLGGESEADAVATINDAADAIQRVGSGLDRLDPDGAGTGESVAARFGRVLVAAGATVAGAVAVQAIIAWVETAFRLFTRG